VYIKEPRLPHTGIDIISHHVFAMLDKLAPELTYHNKQHTADVLQSCERIAQDEGVGKRELYLLRVAALYHDTGFLYIYTGHEEKSCQLFLEDTRMFHFSDEEKELITGIIMATRVPQKPHSLLQKIICDADLDYLGRDDFYSISGELKKEFMHYGFIQSEKEWRDMQVRFLGTHHYHTHSSQQLREPVMKKHWQTIQ